MILVDANLLIYAYDASSPFHARARAWLESELSSGGIVCLPWASLLAFIRITTNPRAFQSPFTIAEAVRVVGDLLDCPTARAVGPTDRHWAILERLLVDGQARGPLASDAHVAALALEYGAVLHTTDRDFARFEGVRMVNPLAES